MQRGLAVDVGVQQEVLIVTAVTVTPCLRPLHILALVYMLFSQARLLTELIQQLQNGPEYDQSEAQ